MKKIIAIVLAVVMIAVCFAGCAAQTAAVSITKTASASASASPAATTAAPAATSAAATASASAITTASSPATETASASSDESIIPDTFTVEGLTSKKLPIYYGKKDDTASVDLYFADGHEDIPFVDMDTAVGIINHATQKFVDKDMSFTCKDDGKGIVTLTRENGVKAEIDFNENEIRYYGFDALFNNSFAVTTLDLLGVSGIDSSGQPQYYSREGVSTFEHAGDLLGIRLKDHNIPTYYKDGKGYMPLATVSDMFMVPLQSSAVYNGQAVFVVQGGFGELSDLYYSAPTGKRSQTLANFNYCELALALDMYYGLKDAHNIDTFEHMFVQTGLADDLLSTDPVVADTAIAKLCFSYFADFHSGISGNEATSSYYAGKDVKLVTPETISTSFIEYVSLNKSFTNQRAQVFPKGCPFYQEVGNTAYVTFDKFTSIDKNVDYYKTPATAETADTLGIIQYAHSQITRKGSPVKNVVLDLSCNGGGSVDAAIYVLGWFLGSATLNINSTLTNAQASTQYKVDTNLDRAFDEKDTLQGRGLNLYCLASPASFSCGNLVPVTFKSSGKVKLLGEQTGGGACAVMPLSTADGTVFQISGYRRIDTVVNGSFIDVDKGAAPDFAIAKLENFYNRKALTKYINSLF